VANTQATFGFKHIGYVSGAAPDYQMASGLIASANTTKIFRGDPVIIDPTTGKIKQAAAGSSQALAGVFDGCVYTPVGGTPQWSPFWPGGGASVDPTAYFINAPGALFQVAAFNTSIVTANIQENVDFNIGTGNTTTGFSGATVDQSTLATTNTLPFRVIAPCTTAGNFGITGNGSDPTTAYGWCVVAFNNTTLKQLQGTA
jgi:hypothetical protein